MRPPRKSQPTLAARNYSAKNANRKVAHDLVPRRNIKVMADAMIVITFADATGMVAIVAARKETCGTARTVSAEIQSMEAKLIKTTKSTLINIAKAKTTCSSQSWG